MSRTSSIIARLDNALNKVGPQDRTSYMRVITRTGGDDLIGRPGTVTFVDTVFNPQPQYNRPSARNLVGPTAKTEDVSDATGQHVIADRYVFLFSPTAITLAQLKNDDMLIVLKDAAGVVEKFDIEDYESISMNGVQVAFLVYVKSMQRP